MTEYFILTDDSMEPRIHKGDTVIFQKKDKVRDGEFAVVIIPESEKIVRKIYRNNFGVILIPLNDNYDRILLHDKQADKLGVHIIGRAFKITRSLA